MNPRSLFLFLIKPNIPISNEHLDLKHTFYNIIQGYLLTLFFIFIIALTIGMPLKLMGLIPPRKIIVTPSIQNIFLMSIIGPIIEELIFRLPLRYKPQYIIISLSLFLFLIGRKLIGIEIVSVIVFINIGVLYYFFYIKKSLNLNSKFNNFWAEHFSFVFYFYTLSFGLLHISSYTNMIWVHYILAPFIVSVQLVMGAFVGYIRVRYNTGVFIAITIHILLNGGTCLIAIVTKSSSIL
ncbi:hypothetical protein E2605_08380 [Dysgonomonas capnocytophagoides]|uniref:CPBP family intramembrane metalloprotease n=1 Tax=Dysgonomonas capnocytophagoides TaxID=45254 RepID=A0A4Y8L2E7_9BACT|nr:hypothetical protein E2605_08380 [Dysgonomonas capnocytophagoides]